MLDPDVLRQVKERLRGHKGTYSVSPSGLADRIEAHEEAVAANLARLEGLKAGDEVSLDGTHFWRFIAMEGPGLVGFFSRDATGYLKVSFLMPTLRAAVKGGAQVIPADRPLDGGEVGE